MPRDSDQRPSTPPEGWHLRYRPHPDGSWTFHLGRITELDALPPACGATGTAMASDGGEATALRLLLGRDEGGVTWCPTCRTQLAQAIAADYEGTTA